MSNFFVISCYFVQTLIHRYIFFTMYRFFSPSWIFQVLINTPNLAPEIHKIWLKTKNLSPDPSNNYFLLHFWATIFQCAPFFREKKSNKRLKSPSCPNFLPQYLMMYQLNSPPPLLRKT